MKTAALLAVASVLFASSVFAQSSPSTNVPPPPGINDPGVQAVTPAAKPAAKPRATDATTPALLYEELRARHGFTLPADRVRGAVNGEFSAATAVLHDGDEVVFIPPVAGG